MKLSWKDGLSFEIFVSELCESVKPKTCKDLEKLSEDLHDRIEVAIEDYISDSDNLNIDDYENQY